jgi:hypothetical protein
MFKCFCAKKFGPFLHCTSVLSCMNPTPIEISYILEKLLLASCIILTVFTHIRLDKVLDLCVRNKLVPPQARGRPHFRQFFLKLKRETLL